MARRRQDGEARARNSDGAADLDGPGGLAGAPVRAPVTCITLSGVALVHFVQQVLGQTHACQAFLGNRTRFVKTLQLACELRTRQVPLTGRAKNIRVGSTSVLLLLR